MSDKFSKYYYRIIVAFLVVLVVFGIMGGISHILGQTYTASIFMGIAVFGALFSLGFLIGGSVYMHIKAYRRVKEKERKSSEAIIKEREDLGEKVLGCARVLRRGYVVGEVHEVLVITPNRVIVEKIAEIGPGSGYGGPPTIDWSDVRLDIPKSMITKVELSKFVRAVKLDILTSEEEYKRYARGLIPEKKGVRLED